MNKREQERDVYHARLDGDERYAHLIEQERERDMAEQIDVFVKVE